MNDPLGLVNGGGGVSDPRQLQPGGAQQAQQPTDEDGRSFKDVLMDNIEQVNQLQQDAEQAIEDLAAGRRDDVANVLIAKQKADTAFKMLLQVRNKMLSAYDEIKQLRV